MLICVEASRAVLHDAERDEARFPYDELFYFLFSAPSYGERRERIVETFGDVSEFC
jgi:hypothetical protein